MDSYNQAMRDAFALMEEAASGKNFDAQQSALEVLRSTENRGGITWTREELYERHSEEPR